MLEEGTCRGDRIALQRVASALGVGGMSPHVDSGRGVVHLCLSWLRTASQVPAPLTPLAAFPCLASHFPESLLLFCKLLLYIACRDLLSPQCVPLLPW